MMLLLLGNKKKRNREASAIVQRLFGEGGVSSQEVPKEQAENMSGQQLQDAAREVMTSIQSDDPERCENALCTFFDIYSERKAMENEGGY